MRTFKKKIPDTIKAFRIGIDEAPDWFTDNIIDAIEVFTGKFTIIAMGEIQIFACTGDYIIKASKGRFTVIKPDIFEDIYDEVKDNDKG